MRALEKDPARRFQTAEEFIAALEAGRHAPTRVVERTAHGRGARPEPARAGGCGCWCCSPGRDRRRRLVPPDRRQRDVPDVIGDEADRGRRRACTTAASRSRSSTRGQRRVPARRGDLAGPEAGGAPRGHDRHPHRLRRRGDGPRCPRVGDSRRERRARAPRRRLRDLRSRRSSPTRSRGAVISRLAAGRGGSRRRAARSP